MTMKTVALVNNKRGGSGRQRPPEIVTGEWTAEGCLKESDELPPR